MSLGLDIGAVGAGTTRAEVLAAHIEALLDEGRVGCGERIATRNQLRTETGLAPATINEAVRLLQTRGRVTVRSGPRGGIFAAQPGPLVRIGQTLLAVRGAASTVADALTVRDTLEPLVAVEAARHRSRADLADLEELVEEMAGCLDDQDAFARTNWRLHQRIAQITPNAVLQAIYINLVKFVDSSAEGMARPAPREFKQHRLDIHRGLVAAIAAADPDAAAAAARDHAHTGSSDR